MTVFWISLFSLWISFVFSEAVSAKPQVIDFHFHLRQGGFDEVHDYLKSEKGSFFDRKMSLLISDGYLKIPDLKSDMFQIQKDVSDFVQQRKEKTRGYCGIEPTRDSYLEEVRWCLKLPGMIGVKLRLDEDNLFLATCQTNQKNFTPQLMEIAREVEHHNGIILIHFPHNSSYYYGELPENDWGVCAEKESRALIELTQKFPKAKFVIAHSGIRSAIGIRGLEYIGEWYKRHPEVKRNLYLEISSVPYIFFGSGLCHRFHPPYVTSACAGSIEWWAKNSEIAQRIFKSWQKFNTNYVLYGSDFYTSAFADNQYAISPLESIQMILLNPILSDREKEKILWKNGEKLLDLK